MVISRRSREAIAKIQTSWLEEPLANPSVLPESERDWIRRVATWRSSIFAWLGEWALGGSSGRMSQMSSVSIKDGILEPFSGSWENAGMGGPTECWTLNSSEFRSGAAASLLSDILETGDLPQRYYLSPTACAGILRRAEKRGKTLPSALERTLRIVATRETEE